MTTDFAFFDVFWKSDRKWPTFQTRLLPQTGQVGSKNFWNIGQLIADNTAQNPKRKVIFNYDTIIRPRSVHGLIWRREIGWADSEHGRILGVLCQWFWAFGFHDNKTRTYFCTHKFGATKATTLLTNRDLRPLTTPRLDKILISVQN